MAYYNVPVKCGSIDKICSLTITKVPYKSFLLHAACLFQNVVAIGAGIVDGLKFGDNTKAAVIRLGLMEMVQFVEEFFARRPSFSAFIYFLKLSIANCI